MFWLADPNLTLWLYILKGRLWLYPSASLHKCLCISRIFRVDEITSFLKEKLQIQVNLFSFCILGSCDKDFLLEGNFFQEVTSSKLFLKTELLLFLIGSLCQYMKVIVALLFWIHFSHCVCSLTIQSLNLHIILVLSFTLI